MIKSYRSREDVLKELLFEINEICEKNDLNYTLTGAVGNHVLDNNKFPEHFDYLTIAMTLGDIERLIEIVNNSNNKDREIEWFLNNPHARGFQVRYCNNNTTCINVKELNTHINYGIYVRIKTIERIPTNSKKRKLLSFFKAAWKGSQKRLSSCNWKLKIPAIILKLFVCIFGRKNIARWLYTFNKKLKYIDKWEDISNNEKVRIGRKIFGQDCEWILKEIYVDDKKVFVTQAVYDKKIELIPKHETVMINDIIDLSNSFSKVINSNIASELFEVQKLRDQYLAQLLYAKRPTKVINKAWNTYLMTRDVIEFQDIYDENKLKDIENLIYSKNYDMYLEEMSKYLLSKKKWIKKGVPFIQNQKLEALITLAKREFGLE